MPAVAGVPETRYARNGNADIAYQVVGDGPVDLVYIPAIVNHLEAAWDDPSLARHCLRLATFSRLILFDPRGTGMSERFTVSEEPTLEQRMQDVRAVMDAAGSARAVVFGTADPGAPLGILFAATYPERVTRLALYASSARRTRAPGYPFGLKDEQIPVILEAIDRTWGSMPPDIAAPSMVDDGRFCRSFARMQRLSTTPAGAVTMYRLNFGVDVRSVLDSVQAPTLVLHTVGDRWVSIGEGRFVADHLPDARFVALPGTDHLYWSENGDRVADEVEEFVTGTAPSPIRDQALATILVTDIVGSTQLASKLGDRRWRDLLENHDRLLRHEFERSGGREVNTTGDGFVATFEGPVRAIRCATAITRAVGDIGLHVRTGLHTGQVEVRGKDIAGVSVHIAARVASLAQASEVLVSRTVKDLIIGSGIELTDRGTHLLKGVPDEWQLFAVAGTRDTAA